jgi:protein-tyrosine phosphatase
MHEIFWIEEGKIAGRRYPTTEELQYLYDIGFRILVSLEQRLDFSEAEAMGWEVHYFDIEDFTSPTIEQVEAFNRIVEASGIVDGGDDDARERGGADTSTNAEDHKANSDPKPILVHCRGGYGRTGTMLAAHLIKHRGMSANEAIDFVRVRRPGAVEVKGQVEILAEYEQHVTKDV